MKKLFAGFVVSSLFAVTVQGSAFLPGDLVVVLDGTGAATLNSSATAAFLQEYNTTTAFQAPIQTIALPTAVSGFNQPLTLAGNATSEGFLSLTTDGHYLMMAGYAATPGTVTPATSTPTAVNRVVGRIDSSGAIDTTTALGDAYNGSNIRSAFSTDGFNIWTSGNGGSGLGTSAAVRYTTLGSTTSVQLNSTTSNDRVVNIFNGQIYASSGSAPVLGVATIGTGTPTTSGQTITLLNGMPTSGTHSSYDFWFKDANTLYVADDGSAASGGGIQKWTLSAGTWSLAYTLLNNGTTTTGVRGLAGTVDGSGNAVLYATTSASSANSLITLTDPGVNTFTFTTLATAPANTDFRGVDFSPTPVPEPTTALLGSLGMLGLLVFRRKK